MGRAFEFRKERKMKRWAGMAKTFTKIGREIAIAVKEGGPNPEYNPRLRTAIQNAKSANMPKANVEKAIKRASSKDAESYDEMLYEGYAPHGIAVIVETTTNNPTRTVANVRHVFSKYGGSLGTSGSVDYMFSRKAIFTVNLPEDQDLEELELELIDFGLEEIKKDGDDMQIVATFEDFGKMQKALDEQNIEVVRTEFERIPSMYKTLTDDQVEEVIKLIDKMEDEDDVAAVFHNMNMDE